MFYLKKRLLSLFLVASMSLTSLQASEEHNLTDVQLHAVMGIITNFILSSSPVEPPITHNGTTYDTVTSPYTGKVWLDRNLGANRVCTAVQDANCYGDYYQWGRGFDGHQEEDSNETNVLAPDVHNPGSRFITSSVDTYDWTAGIDVNGTQRMEKWAKVDGSSVCPTGFRVPSINELKAELFEEGADINNSADAYASFLKLPSADSRSNTGGTVSHVFTKGSLWANSIFNSEGAEIRYDSFDDAGAGATYRAYGENIRCIQSDVSPVVDIPVFTSDDNISVDEGETDAFTITAPTHGSVMYALYGVDSSAFDINMTTGVVTFKTAPDFATKSSYTLLVAVTASSGNVVTQEVTIHILDTTPPTFTSEDNSTVAENQTSAITLQATDASAISYAISGADSADFDVNATSGVVTFKVAPDFETKDTYTFTATTTDAFGNESTQEVTIEIEDVNETIVHNGTTYGTVISPYTGKEWLDRNLGANRVCTSFDDTECYGDYYQWGRNFDGHQESNSTTTSTRATDVNATGSSFIIGSSDWASVDGTGTTRTTNWSALDGSSVCPVGFRVPTLIELRAELLDAWSAQIQNRDDAFNSFLALPSAGYRSRHSGSLGNMGSWGYLWTSSVDRSYSHSVDFYSSGAYSYNDYRAYGFTVRCLRD